MKKTGLIEFFMIIRKNIVPFVCILMMCTLGSAFYLGVNWYGKTFNRSVEDTLNQYHLYDLRILCPLGIREADIERIKEVDGVSTAEGGYLSYNIISCGDIKSNVKIMQLTKETNLPYFIEGRLPEKEGEVAISRRWAKDYGIKIGDSLRLQDSSHLNCSDLVVSAITESVVYCDPDLIQNESSPFNGAIVQGFMYASEDTFDKSSFGGYPEVLIRCNIPDIAFENGYSEKIQVIKKQVEELCDSLVPYSLLKNLPYLTDDKNIHPDSLKCCVLTRSENTVVHMMEVVPEINNKIKNALGFGVLFISIVIAVFIVFRLVHKDRIVIGTQLSFGISKTRIAWTYCGFAITAATAGCILGTLIGRFFIQPIMMNTSTRKYWAIERALYYFSVSDVLILSLCLILIITIVGFISCSMALNSSVLDMLQDIRKSVGKRGKHEATAAWQKLPLLKKSVINNIRSDKLRVWTTIISIAGSTALMICGAGVYLAMPYTINRQLDKYQKFNRVIYADPENEEAQLEIEKTLKKENIRYTPVYSSFVTVKTEDGNVNYANMMVSDRNFGGMFHLYEAKNNRDIPLTDDKKPENGFFVSSALNYYKDADSGRNLTVTDVSGQRKDITIAGLYKSFLPEQQILCSGEQFKKVFGYYPNVNAFLVNSNDSDHLNHLLSDIDGYLFVFDYEAKQRSFFESYISLAVTICIMCIFLAIFQAVFMLSNLFEMNLKEKRREVVTLIMNGYSTGDAKCYIFLDIKYLLPGGLCLGIPFGIIFERITIYCLQSQNTCISYHIVSGALIFSLVIMTVLTLLIGIISISAIDKLSLTESAVYNE